MSARKPEDCDLFLIEALHLDDPNGVSRVS
jgi:hypothetical protein